MLPAHRVGPRLAGASGEASKKPGPIWPTARGSLGGRPCRLRLARDGHRSPAIDGADRRDRRPEEQVIHLHSESASNEPDEGGRSARRRGVYPPRRRRVNSDRRLCRQPDSRRGGAARRISSRHDFLSDDREGSTATGHRRLFLTHARYEHQQPGPSVPIDRLPTRRHELEATRSRSRRQLSRLTTSVRKPGRSGRRRTPREHLTGIGRDEGRVVSSPWAAHA